MKRNDLVFGLHAVESAISNTTSTVTQLYIAKGRQDTRLRDLLALANQQDIAVQVLPRSDLDLMVGDKHQGVVAQITLQRGGSEEDLLLAIEKAKKPPLLLILDGVQDPHNLGACLRSADAAGVMAVIAPKDRAVSVTPTVRKVACGAAESVPFIQVTNLARYLKKLQDAGVWLYGLAGEATKTLYEIDLKGPTGLVLGAEGSGLRRLTRETCDELAMLPMSGSVSSLNVSVAAGVSLFEVVRQRRS